MRMIVAGATGAIGIPLVKQLVADGHSVVGITRTQRGVATLTGIGAEGVVADVLDRDALLRATNGLAADAVVHELTALAKPPARHADMRATDRLRTEGTAHLLEVAGQIGAGRFITQSMVFGYGYRDLGDTPLTEDAPFGVPQGDAFDEHLAAMRSAEQQAFEASGVDGIALRYGLFYGADAASVAPPSVALGVGVSLGVSVGCLSHCWLCLPAAEVCCAASTSDCHQVCQPRKSSTRTPAVISSSPKTPTTDTRLRLLRGRARSRRGALGSAGVVIPRL